MCFPTNGDLFMTTDKNISYKSLLNQGQHFVSLKIDGWRLFATEKATVALSTMIFGAIVLLLGMYLTLFLSMALVHFLTRYISIIWAYLATGGFFAIILLIVVVLRRHLIVDPMARFLSRLFLNQPDSNDNEPKE